MNTKSLKTLCYLVFLLLGTIAARAQKAPQYIFPTGTFNEVEATKLLDDGTNTIRGVATLKKRGVYNFPDMGDKILLFPVTPYLIEFLELRKKYNSRKKQAAMAADAFIYRIETKFSDSKGSFEIKNLRPGKYYAITWIAYQKEQKYTVQTGTSTSYNIYGQALSSWPIKEERSYYYDVEKEVTGFIEVSGDKQVINAMVKNY